MKGLLKFSRAVDAFNTRLGQIVAWAILVAVLVSAANAIVRKVFNTSSNSLARASMDLVRGGVPVVLRVDAAFQ